MRSARSLTLLTTGLVLGLSLACGTDAGLPGLGGGDKETPDPAEKLRRQGDFLGAEGLLEVRLAENPGDAEAFKILGDVKVSRAQKNRKKWVKNLKDALDAYKSAVMEEPTNCKYWNRLAFAVASASEDDQVKVSTAWLDELPLETGWFECPGGSLAILEDNRAPTDEQKARASQAMGGQASRYQLFAATKPDLVEGYKRINLGELEWKAPRQVVEPAEGLFFVILEGPVQARVDKGEGSRELLGPEWMSIVRVEDSSVVFRDTKVRSKTRAQGVVKAGACPGTSWSLGNDGMPLGYCVKGPYNPKRSRVYDPRRLKVASPSHYDQPTIEDAKVDGSTIVQGSVSCTGGAVGRLFVEEATCSVEYYRASAIHRIVPAAAGLVAETQEEAERMVDAYGMGAVYGPALGKRLARGEYAEGMPWPLWAQTRLQDDLYTCTGRRLLQRSWFKEDTVEFYCSVGRKHHHFRDFVYLGAEVDSK